MAQDQDDNALLLRFFSEISVIAQLSSNAFERILPHGLTQAQFTMLNHAVRLGDGWTPARLAEAFQITKGTFTSTLKRLEAKGFVRVEPDPEDGRSKRVFLTEAGRAAREDALAAAAPLFARVPEAISSSDMIDLLPALEKLHAWLDENR